MKLESRERLICFCEKAEQVGKGRYFARLLRGEGVRLGFSLDPRTGHFKDMGFMGPDEEDVRALLLTMRMFCIKKDNISPERLEAMAANDPALSPHWRQRLAQARAAVEQMLEEPAAPEGLLHVPSPKCGDVFDTFLYGEYAHVNDLKRAQYQRWKQEPYFPLLQFCFSASAAKFICEVLSLAKAARHELLSGD